MGISLINHMAVLIVVAYVLTRTKLYSEVIIEKKLTLKNGIILSVIFGLFSIYGTMSGIKIFDATANIRDLGPAIAGLIAGPLVGVGAGLIGRSSSLLSGRSYLRSMFGSNAFCRTLRRHYISCKKEKDHHDTGRYHLCRSPRNFSHGTRIFLESSHRKSKPDLGDHSKCSLSYGTCKRRGYCNLYLHCKKSCKGAQNRIRQSED